MQRSPVYDTHAGTARTSRSREPELPGWLPARGRLWRRNWVAEEATADLGYTAVERRRRREQASRQAEQEGTEARITGGTSTETHT